LLSLQLYTDILQGRTGNFQTIVNSALHTLTVEKKVCTHLNFSKEHTYGIKYFFSASSKKSNIVEVLSDENTDHQHELKFSICVLFKTTLDKVCSDAQQPCNARTNFDL
jgi:hypothetical protein